jgi:hypothetical protein
MLVSQLKFAFGFDPCHMVSWKATIGRFGPYKLVKDITYIAQNHKTMVVFGLENTTKGRGRLVHRLTPEGLKMFHCGVQLSAFLSYSIFR